MPPIAAGVLARSQSFRNKLKMASFECQCTEYMCATYDMHDTNWGTLLVCVGVIFLILRHLRNEESDEGEGPSTM
eukprot:COSAG05_NODE_22182_length_266_cov_1.095808_1_plen_74_part_01